MNRPQKSDLDKISYAEPTDPTKSPLGEHLRKILLQTDSKGFHLVSDNPQITSILDRNPHDSRNLYRSVSTGSSKKVGTTSFLSTRMMNMASSRWDASESASAASPSSSPSMFWTRKRRQADGKPFRRKNTDKHATGSSCPKSDEADNDKMHFPPQIPSGSRRNPLIEI